jgi:uncharacterized protein (TIRG00374 family)
MNIMAKNSWLGRRWKLILNLVTLVALLILVYAIRHQLGDTIRNLAHVHAWILLLMIPIEALNYHAQVRMYQRLFRIVGNQLPYKYLYKTSLELNFVNHVFPSGGVTGVSYFGLRMRDGDKLSSGKATLVQIMKLGLTFLSFEILIIFGLFCLAIMGRVNSLVILVAGSLSTLLVVGTIGFVYVVGSKARINGFFTGVTKGLNRLIHIVRPRYPETISVKSARKVFDDFHNNYEAIQENLDQLKRPFWYALLANITEVAALYIVYLAFGKPVNIGAVILAYGIANFAGLVSVLPGGVGIYEALMTAVLASTGVSPAVSLPVTIMYRVVNTLIQIPPGYYLYQQNLSGRQQPPGTSGAT